MKNAKPLLTRVVGIVSVIALLCATACLAACSVPGSSTSSAASASSETRLSQDEFRNTDIGCGWQPTGSLDLQYANQFSVDYYEGGYALACLADGARYLFIPDGAQAPDGLSTDIVAIDKSVNNIYLVATDTMCLFDALGVIGRIRISGSEADDWYIDSAKAAMESGEIVYGGKYSAPDYDIILSNGCKLAIESTMINHSPEVKEKLETLGIPVLVEQSSYESEPLGRTEWVKFYGAMFGMEQQAQALFEEQVAQTKAVQGQSTGKSVAFFYISSSGSAVTRKPGDYVSKMIDLAGASNVFTDLGTGSNGTVTLEMEKFYATAKDADVIIYNATIDGNVDSLASLLSKNELLKNFKAVQAGEVYCTQQNMYQQMMQTGTIIKDFHTAFTGGDTASMTYLYRLS